MGGFWEIAGHEHGESYRREIFHSEQHLVGGNFGIGWIPDRHFSLRAALFWSQWIRRCSGFTRTFQRSERSFIRTQQSRHFSPAGGRNGTESTTELTTVFDYPLYFALRDVVLNDAPAGRIANILSADCLSSA